MEWDNIGNAGRDGGPGGFRFPQHLDAARAFRERNGHLHPLATSDDPEARSLAGWLSKQRRVPAMPPPHPLTRTTRVAPGRYAGGDHRATGSVQGALASGARAAREVLRDLR
ncbi:helicase associated domain-containing protein [Streptomyces sp. NPDC091268]|uniref:helicase associated domain-containing protein n=1 Tax=Streptomyces sp. NPDC091268 TaxID=3365979 RepID=UPI00381963BC